MGELSDIYDRQSSLNLNTNKSFTVVGAGGIGYWVCKFLAMSGIEKIYVFDPDILEESNLNRLDIPEKFIGRNKAEMAKIACEQIRNDLTIISFPFPLQAQTFPATDWLIDCTDDSPSQELNQKIANQYGAKYFKAGYDGEHFSVFNTLADWGEDQDGYVVIPSWVVPAVIVAALAVAKALKYTDKEVCGTISDIFKKVF